MPVILRGNVEIYGLMNQVRKAEVSGDGISNVAFAIITTPLHLWILRGEFEQFLSD